MDSGFVRERIASGDGFVRLHGNAGNFAQQLAGRENLLTDNAGLIRIAIGAHAHRHDNLFQRSVARAFANSVNCALHLARSGGDRRHGVRHRQTEIIVAVR
jgi:hypothetical protein